MLCILTFFTLNSKPFRIIFCFNTLFCNNISNFCLCFSFCRRFSKVFSYIHKLVVSITGFVNLYTSNINA